MEIVGTKKDVGKDRWDLLFWDAVEEVVKVSTYGSKKYADRNCESGISYGRVFAGVLRHLVARFIHGERINKEDGNLLHLAQAAWGILLLLAYDLRGLDVKHDDLTPGHRIHETNPEGAKA